jgi:hypothetical protein
MNFGGGPQGPPPRALGVARIPGTGACSQPPPRPSFPGPLSSPLSVTNRGNDGPSPQQIVNALRANIYNDASLQEEVVRLSNEVQVHHLSVSFMRAQP